MWYLIRALLGLCNHKYVVMSKEDVPFVGNEGSFVSIDLAHRGAIKERLYIKQCCHCAHITTQKVKV